MSRLTYRQAHQQSNREAIYCLLASVVLTICFWAAIFLTQDSSLSIWGVPLWFWLSCVGGYVLSVLFVWLLIRFKMKNFSLEVKSMKNEEDKK